MVDATCTEAAYCQREGCDHTEGEALGHDYSDEWSAGENGHWHECSRCGEKADFADHDFGDEGDQCVECGYERDHIDISGYLPEGYDFVGWTTDVDSAIFNDVTAISSYISTPETDAIITAEIVPNEMHEHSYRKWIVNEDGTHTGTCICGAEVTENHVFDASGQCICGKSVEVGISGTITSYSDEEAEILVELLNESGEVVSSVTVTGNSAEYSLTEIPSGEYTLQISKESHVTRTYAVSVAEEDVVQDVKICLQGDVSGDGKVSATDCSRLLALVKKT